MSEPRFRIASNPWNIDHAPWRGAVGIEDTGDYQGTVPPVVCWFTRGISSDLAQKIVDLLNGKQK